MAGTASEHVDMPLGIVVRRSPGVTRWVRWIWRPVAVLPGAGPATGTELRREGDTIEHHAATVTLTLWAADAEAYLVNLSDRDPSIYVVLRNEGNEAPGVLLATASPYEAQDYDDNGEDVVEKVPMPAGLIAWVRDYAHAHHQDEKFIKRRRDRARVDLHEDGIGDARIRQAADVYRAPRPAQRRQTQ